MAKVVIKKLEDNTARKIRPETVSVQKERVLDAEGNTRVLRTIDTNSRSFGNDLTYVFTRNVKKARDENLRVTGRRDADLPRK